MLAVCCWLTLVICCLGLLGCWAVLKIYLWVTNSYLVPGKEGFEECILITGCDSGIGRNTALRLCKDGFVVFAACLFDESFPSLLEDSSSCKGTIIPLMVDIRSEESVKQLGSQIESELKTGNRRLFAVVNNAGVITNGPIEMQPMKSVEFQMDVNVLGQIRMMQETTRFIRESRGRVVNTVSIAGRTTTGAIGVYCASKHAMEGITDAYRVELKPWKISVSAIEPGVIDTDLARSVANNEEIWNKLKPGAKEIYPKLYKDSARTGGLGIAGAPVDTVSDAIIHAITSSHPKTRYLVGNDARALAFIKWACSDRLFDLISEFTPKFADWKVKRAARK